MKIKSLVLFVQSIGIGLAFVLSGCSLLPAETPEVSPEEVVSRFYRWYIGYPGNPLADQEYRTSPYLAESFIQKVDETLASLAGGGYDPILLAQDIPESFAVDNAVISDNEASAIVHLHWSGNPLPSDRKIALKRIDGQWKISDISH